METSNSIWRYLAVIRKRLWIILLLFAATMVIILVRAWSMPPVYRSSLTLQVIPLEPEEVTLFTRTNTISMADLNDLTLFQFTNAARRSSVALRAIEAAGVNISPGELLDGLQITRDPSGDKITVSVTARDPQAAQQLVVTQVEEAQAELRQTRSLPAVVTGKFLETELTSADRDLATAKDELLRFKLANNMESVEREINAEQDAIRSVSGTREAADVEAQRLVAMAEELERQSKEAETKAQEAEARVKAATAKKQEAPDDVEAAAVWHQVAQDLARTGGNRRADAAGQRAVGVGYTGLVSQHQSNLTSLITLGGQHQKLLDAVKERQDARDFLAGKVLEARLKQAQSQNVGYLQVVGEPVTPGGQVSTRTLEIAIIGGGLSLVAGIVLVFLLEFLEQTVRQRPQRTR
jgi:uncharacterized protein involved in exopolysaccharide biosynthesis